MMKIEDIAAWGKAARENPLKTLGLFIAALLIVAAFSFAGEFGKNFRISAEPAAPEKRTLKTIFPGAAK